MSKRDDPPGDRLDPLRPAAPELTRVGDRLDLACLVADYRSVPPGVRSSLALRFQEAIPAGSGVLLSTCHRVEAFVAPASIADGMRSDLPSGVRLLLAEEAVGRAISLGVGLESAIVAEDQLLHQVREAVGGARLDHPLAASLDRLGTSWSCVARPAVLKIRPG